VRACFMEKERGREREWEREKQRGREREWEREKQKGREKQEGRGRERNRDREREKQGGRERETGRGRDRNREGEGDRNRERETIDICGDSNREGERCRMSQNCLFLNGMTGASAPFSYLVGINYGCKMFYSTGPGFAISQSI
jgi:hypothetical protein